MSKPSDAAVAARPRLWRITDRSTFRAFRGARRVRRGAVSVVWLAPSTDAPPSAFPRVAFGTGRSLGGAVIRNRIRRRLRHGLREVQVAGNLPPGSYLIGGGAAAADCPWSELVSDLSDAVSAATGQQQA